MTSDASRQERFGFFGVVGTDGLVRDLTLDSIHLVVGGGSRYIGALAGFNDGVLDHCQVSATLVIEMNTDDWYDAYDVLSEELGGEVGYNAGVLVHCGGSVSVRVEGHVAANVGGLVGGNCGAVYGCWVAGEIATDVLAEQLGGLVGSNEQGTVRGCSANVSVAVAVGYRGENIGGLAGANSGLLSRCGASGTMT